MVVSNILEVKGRKVFASTGEINVYEAVKIMGEKNIGALMIIEDNKLIGIFSERDYARKIILVGKSSRTTLVKEIMTRKVITITPDDSIEKCMELMSEKNFRHLPVVQNNTVIGMISITDVVTAIISTQKETIKHLQNYISQ
jgi:CBS domain-containing protein